MSLKAEADTPESVNKHITTTALLSVVLLRGVLALKQKSTHTYRSLHFCLYMYMGVHMNKGTCAYFCACTHMCAHIYMYMYEHNVGSNSAQFRLQAWRTKGLRANRIKNLGNEHRVKNAGEDFDEGLAFGAPGS